MVQVEIVKHQVMLQHAAANALITQLHLLLKGDYQTYLVKAEVAVDSIDGIIQKIEFSIPKEIYKHLYIEGKYNQDKREALDRYVHDYIQQVVKSGL